MDPWIPWEFMLVTANRDHIYQKCFGTKILLEELERDDKNSLVNSESGNEGGVSSAMVRKSLEWNSLRPFSHRPWGKAKMQCSSQCFINSGFGFVFCNLVQKKTITTVHAHGDSWTIRIKGYKI